MKISDLIGMCLRNLFRRKFRTFLTIMGVVIGTCAIVVMVSLGIGISKSQEAWLNSIGDLTVITVWNYGGQDVHLDDEAVRTMEAIPNVSAVNATWRWRPSQGNINFYAGKRDRYASWMSPMGVNPEALQEMGYELAEGSFPQAGSKKIQLMLGEQSAYEFYEQRSNKWIDSWPDQNGNVADPFFDPRDTDIVLVLTYYDSEENKEKELRLETEVVGFVQQKEGDYYSQYGIYMHIDALKDVQAQYEKEFNIKKDRDAVDEYDEVRVKVSAVDKVVEVENSIEAMGFYPYSLGEMREEMQKNAQQIQMILGALGGISLFVAAISITNTMIMSVYERTREIGVMKVLGCLVSDVRKVFLVEAGLIGLIGGIVGIILSALLSFLLNTFGSMIGNIFAQFPMMEGSKISEIPPWLMLGGMAFATFIGLISGFSPANRAVKISALEAIRTE